MIKRDSGLGRPGANKENNPGFVLIIINSIPPYCYEINNILAQPDGFEYRVRFQKHWIPTIPSPVQISGNDGLIVLRDFDTGRFYPIRRIHITKVLPVGEIFYIRFRLQSLVELSSSDQDRLTQLDQFNNLLSTAVGGYENHPGGDLENLIFFGTDFTYALEDKHFTGHEVDREYNRWGNITKTLGSLSTYRDVDFYRIVSLDDQSTNPAPIKLDEHGLAKYVLRSASSYTLQVLQRTFTGRTGNSSVLSSRRIRLRAEAEDVQIVQGDFPITGKYDMYPFLFRTNDRASKKYSFLLLQISAQEGAGLEMPALQLPILIEVPPVKIVVAIAGAAVFVIASLSLFFPGFLLTALGIDANTANTDLFQKVSLLVMALTATNLGRVSSNLLSMVKVSFPTR